LRCIWKYIHAHGIELLLGEFLGSLGKGQCFELSGRRYEVAAPSAKTLRLHTFAGKTISAFNFGSELWPGGSGKKSPFDALRRDLEGQVMIDLVNEHNPGHPMSGVLGLMVRVVI